MSENENTTAAASPVIAMRLTPEARAALEARAVEAGMTAGEFAKAAVLQATGAPAPARRRNQLPPLDADAIRAAVGAVNRVGNLLNQLTLIARKNALSSGPTDQMAATLKIMQADWARAIDALQAAAGVKVRR